MSAQPAQRVTPRVRPQLQSFEPQHAELVAAWVVDAREALWLAPRTLPPITALAIRAWRLPDHEPLQLIEAEQRAPVAYGELNVLSRAHHSFWLGHLLVEPARRGGGLGQLLTRLLLQRAFLRYRARQVSLVVFPENGAAIACYHAAGLRPAGYEDHYLPAYGRGVRLLRLTTTAF